MNQPKAKMLHLASRSAQTQRWLITILLFIQPHGNPSGDRFRRLYAKDAFLSENRRLAKARARPSA